MILVYIFVAIAYYIAVMYDIITNPKHADLRKEMNERPFQWAVTAVQMLLCSVVWPVFCWKGMTA